jgi:hypothetical protein
MRLENLELDDRHEAQAELSGLAEDLEAEGFDVEVAPEDASVLAKLQESAEHVFVDVLNVVLNHAEGLALDATLIGVAHALRRWARRRKHFRGREGAKPTALIWGPDGEILREIELPDADESD